MILNKSLEREDRLRPMIAVIRSAQQFIEDLLCFPSGGQFSNRTENLRASNTPDLVVRSDDL